jgi:RNA polymerase sigma-70 factor (ECF subfamily)
MTEKEFLDLIHTHQGTIHHLLKLYVQDTQDKDDLKQEIILQAWRSKDKFRQESSFNTWLYKLSLYTILTSRRKKEKIKQVDLEEAEKVHDQSNPEREEVELLYKLISELDDLSKTVITMHLDGFSNPEIAIFMGVSTNNLNVKLHRIKERITKKIIGRTNGTR